MLENYVDAAEAAKILGVHLETVKRLIRDGKLPALKFANNWIIERDRLLMFAESYDDGLAEPGAFQLAVNATVVMSL